MSLSAWESPPPHPSGQWAWTSFMEGGRNRKREEMKMGRNRAKVKIRVGEEKWEGGRRGKEGGMVKGKKKSKVGRRENEGNEGLSPRGPLKIILKICASVNPR